MSGMIKTYTELTRLQTFQERFEYLKLDGSVGIETFGFDRYLNQIFYNSKEWKRLRNEIIVRDKGCDLACDGYEIQGNIIIHHMNPITPEDIINRLTDEMLSAAQAMEFEKAAELRDKIKELEKFVGDDKKK